MVENSDDSDSIVKKQKRREKKKKKETIIPGEEKLSGRNYTRWKLLIKHWLG